MTIVIFGAGPTGLYLAERLKMIGVEDIIVVDPRAGHYVRPGHINSEAISKAERGLNKKLQFFIKQSHIKDIERALYNSARTQMPIKTGRFVRFSTQPKGVIIEENGVEKLIECEYVFDCTGAKRALIHELNAIAKKDETKPFNLSFISSKVTVKNHLLAYIKMSREDVDLFDRLHEDDILGFADPNPAKIVDAFERLRQLGWREFGFPRCYNVEFGKNKVCFYIETPDALPEDKKEAWLQTVLECLTGKPDIKYQLLPDSKKHQFKPRLVTFNVDPQELDHFCFQANELPTVIAHGDAQIDPNYYLAHGLVNAFDRINRMIKNLKIKEGTIIDFNKDEFEKDMKNALKVHRSDIVEHYEERQEYFANSLRNAKEYYGKVLETRKELFLQERLKEITARISYFDALDFFEEIYQEDLKIELSCLTNLSTLIIDLTKAKKLFISVLCVLPPDCVRERKDTQLKLELISNYSNKLSHCLSQRGEFMLAKQASDLKSELPIFESPIEIGLRIQI